MTPALRNYLKRVADAFESATHAPDSPAVYVAYGKFKAELLAQFELLCAFVDVAFYDVDPYGNYGYVDNVCEISISRVRAILAQLKAMVK